MTDYTQELLERVNMLQGRVIDLERQEPDRIYIRYTTAAGQVIPNTTITIVDFDTLASDDDGLVTTGASWHFTARVGGLYLVAASVQFTNTTAWALGESAMLMLYRNGALHSYLEFKDNFGGASQYMTLRGAGLLLLTAGWTADLRVSQNSGGSLALSTNADINYVGIAKL